MSIISQFFPSSGGGGTSAPATTTVAELLIVSGGGGGCYSCNRTQSCAKQSPTGGTGGAVLRSSRFCFEQGCPYTITVGSGAPGPSWACGSPSSIIGGPFCNRVNLIVEGSGICWAHAEQIDAYTNICGHATPGPSIGIYCPSPGRYDFVPHGGGGAGGIGSYGEFIACATACTSQYYANSGSGGPGVMSNILGSRNFYGGGGAGGEMSYYTSSCYASGGIGGGGRDVATGSCNGASNTGGGGGGGSTSSNGGSGGSGIVVIRYPSCYRSAPSVTGNTPAPAQSGYYVYLWNGSGSITF